MPGRNLQFHQIINTHAANTDASDIVDRYQDMLRAFRRAYGFDPTRLPGVIADHRALLGCFEAGDADGAAAIAAGHAAKARNDLIRVIRSAAPQAEAAERPSRPRDRKSTRLNSSHSGESRMPSSA